MDQPAATAAKPKVKKDLDVWKLIENPEESSPRAIVMGWLRVSSGVPLDVLDTHTDPEAESLGAAQSGPAYGPLDLEAEDISGYSCLLVFVVWGVFCFDSMGGKL